MLPDSNRLSNCRLPLPPGWGYGEDALVLIITVAPHPPNHIEGVSSGMVREVERCVQFFFLGSVPLDIHTRSKSKV